MKNKSLRIIKCAMVFFTCAIGFNGYSQEDEEAYEGLQLKLNDSWKIKFSGQINAYYVNTQQKEDLANGIEKENFSSIQNGINQATIAFNPVYTMKNGGTVSGTFDLAFGITNHGVDSSAPAATGFGYSSVDIRQAFIQVTTPKSGSFIIGKTFGGFGLDALIYDVSILGIGANYSYDNPQNTTLAGIGYGYVFADKMAQISYTTPSFFNKTSSLTLGVYEPFATSDFNGAFGDPFGVTDNPNSLGYQGKFVFNKSYEKTNVYFSSAFISQEVSDNNQDLGLNGFGIDAFLKVAYEGFTLSGYYYTANGIGDAGIMFGPAITVNSEIETIKSDGYYGQITYKLPKNPITLGINYGASRVKDEIIDNRLEYSDSATRFTNSVAYAINSNLVVKTEYTIQGRHKIFAPEANVFSLGGYFLF
ncbi:hypothetical secreted protein [unidentified eubacterium SCB49]|nr:hypothetical secreted protein [unidentified eubacterium SCB49]